MHAPVTTSTSRLPARRSGATGWIGAALVVGTLVTLVALERRRPLRPVTEAPTRRDARNLAIAAISAVTVAVAGRPLVSRVAQQVEHRRWGMLKQRHLSPWVELPLAIAWMDYTLYVWHILTHRVPVLWRFHLIHHVDRDLSATTALRFHFGELLLSVPWRVAQIVIGGVGPRALSMWQNLLFVSTFFHHSNLRLSPATERHVARWVMTPRLHGIHHSQHDAERDSNWSSGLTLWDRLHRSYRDCADASAISIGVPGYEKRRLTLARLLAMPFRRQV